MKKTLVILIMLLTAALVFSIHRNMRLSNYSNTYTDTITVKDTIPYLVPEPYDSVVIKYQYISIPANPDTPTDSADIQIIESDSDSIKITIPITQHRYEGKDYMAWISGYEAKLDSIWVFASTTTITKPSVNTAKLKIDAYTGFMLADRHITPYINIGIFTYTKNRKYEIGIAAGIQVEGNTISPCWNFSVRKNLFSW